MDTRDKLQQKYDEMCQNFEGGLSNTSTKKFDPIRELFAETFNLPVEDIYAVGSGSRPGNIEVRLSQGTRATTHTTLGLAFIVDEVGTPENRLKLTQSAFVTIEKFLGRGKSSYENVLVIIDSKGTIYVDGLVHSQLSSYSQDLVSTFNIPNVKEVEVHTSENAQNGPVSNGFINLLPKEDLVPKVRESFIKFWNLIDQHGADYDYYVKCFEETINPYIEKLALGIDNVFQIINYADYVSIIKRITKENPEAAFLINGRKNGGDKYVAASTHLHYKNYLEILSISDFIRIPVEPARLKNADDVIQESSFRQFARSVMQHFYQKDEFDAFFDSLRVFRKSGDTFKWVADGTNLMFKANNATEEAGYFMDEYHIDGVIWYLSSSPRTERFPLFANFIHQHYPEYYAEKRNGNYYLCKLTDDKAVTKPLQLIYYGAPGTGKSHTIAKETNPRNSVRTTFHPDSDYASFVGAYKPTMDEVEIPALVGTNVQNAVGVNGHTGKQKKIVYKYVPQAFLKAYVAAWKSYGANTPYYLIIEEINRGNCAQIFGDLFQLLDRSDEGYSSYPIDADDDIRKFLVSDDKGFKGLDATSPEAYAAISGFEVRDENGELIINGAEILSGEKLLLPQNLYIWATMNTSDQSLFPIDSAFKRRWNWEYKPISYVEKDWLIEVGGKKYNWGQFLEKINPIITKLTESPDKQMGFYFVRPRKGSKVINEDVFLNKVLFYLWTDVIKDFADDDDRFKDSDTKEKYDFSDFFKKDKNRVAEFIGKLELDVVDDNSSSRDDVYETKEEGYKPLAITINGKKVTTITDFFYEIMSMAAKQHPYSEIESKVKEVLPYEYKALTIKSIDDATTYQKENKWNKNPLTAIDGQAFVVTNQWQREYLPSVKQVAELFNVEFEDAAE